MASHAAGRLVSRTQALRNLVGKHHSRHKADRHARCREKQNFAQPILQVQNSPAMHPYAPLCQRERPCGSLVARFPKMALVAVLYPRTVEDLWNTCLRVATARGDPKQLVKLRV